MTNTTNNATLSYPYPITADTPTGQLIDRINAALATTGETLVWRETHESSNPANVTRRAYVTPHDDTNTRGLEPRIEWSWTPRVGKTQRSAQYKSLATEFAVELDDVPAPSERQQERRAMLDRIDSATDFDTEQAAQVGAPGVDIRTDGMRGDSGRLWRLHARNLTDEDRDDFSAICRRMNLPYERGVRAYYVLRDTLARVKRNLDGAGFCVALDLDAAQALR